MEMKYNKTLKYLTFILILLPVTLWSQQVPETKLFERLQAISVGNIDYYNIDGVTISCQVTNIPFSKDNICKNLSLKQYMLSKSASFISQKNFIFERIDTICENVIQNNTNYFVENKNGYITHIIYMSIGKQCLELQKSLTHHIIERKIPESVFNDEFFNTLNFAGRKVDLETYGCQWKNVNSVQCPFHGQMSWSVHCDSLDAVQTVELKRYITANCKTKDFKAVTDEQIDIVFEGQQLKARRITYQVEKELGSLLLKTGDGNTKTLIIYYIVAPVRGNYISCIMSHWNNDFIEKESRLPSLLEKFMQLKN